MATDLCSGKPSAEPLEMEQLSAMGKQTDQRQYLDRTELMSVERRNGTYKNEWNFPDLDKQTNNLTTTKRKLSKNSTNLNIKVVKTEQDERAKYKLIKVEEGQ